MLLTNYADSPTCPIRAFHKALSETTHNFEQPTTMLAQMTSEGILLYSDDIPS